MSEVGSHRRPGFWQRRNARLEAERGSSDMGALDQAFAHQNGEQYPYDQSAIISHRKGGPRAGQPGPGERPVHGSERQQQMTPMAERSPDSNLRYSDQDADVALAAIRRARATVGGQSLEHQPRPGHVPVADALHVDTMQLPTYTPGEKAPADTDGRGQHRSADNARDDTDMFEKVG